MPDRRRRTRYPQAVSEALELLLGYALLSATADQTLAMHRLVGQLTRERGTSDERRRAAGAAIALASEVLPSTPYEHQHRPACQRLLSHALAAAGHAEHRGTSRDHTATVLGRVGQYQEARAEFAQTREVFQRALAIFEAEHGAEREPWLPCPRC